MQTSVQSGSNNFVFATEEPSVAQNILAQALGPNKLLPTEGRSSINLAYHSVDLQAISIHRVSFGAPVMVEVPAPETFFLLQLTLAGNCVSAWDEGWTSVRANEIFIVNPKQAVRKYWSEDARQLMVKIDRQDLQRHFAVAMGRSRLPTIEFESGPFAAGSTDTLNSLLTLMSNDFASERPLMIKPIVARHMVAAFFSVLLHTVPHNGSHLLGEPSSPAVPHYVRRAEEFIRRNLREDFGLADIATFAGVSARSLTTGFRRFRQETPMGYVRNMRLERAHQMLLDRNSADWSVTTIALSCGIRHLSRFAQDYAARFGELPSVTLRRL